MELESPFVHAQDDKGMPVAPTIFSETIPAAPREKIGGNIALKTTVGWEGVAIGFIMILVLYLIWVAWVYWARGETYHQQKTRLYFENTHGEEFDDDARATLYHGEAIQAPTAMDNYRIGTVYLINAQDPERAHARFTQALGQVAEGQVATADAPFIIDRIGDYQAHFEAPLADLPIQDALIGYYTDMRKQADLTYRRKAELKADDPDFAAKLILTRQTWKADTQNVHDSAIYKELAGQYKIVTEGNRNMKNRDLRDYQDLSNWLRLENKGDPDREQKITQVLKFLDHNYPVTGIEGAGEQDVITAVWQRAHADGNEENCEKIKVALSDCVSDCVEKEKVVCISGRLAKVWQSMALLDKDPQIGVLMTKQALRNEVYERAAAVVSRHVGPDGMASEGLKADYTASATTPQVQELIKTIHGELDGIGGEYSGLLPKAQLDLVIEECKSVV
jgi:hypothetical protein